ncbi:MAG: hypothetical protein L0Y72_12960 [Gemmataceae bacterium]|nr:hypothetical protein [Gemmataceae bacterium]MCI0739948.1 hypothetical protein [Gemmataceae bacterium]
MASVHSLRWACVLLLAAVLVSSQSPAAQDKPAGELDATAKKLLGAFQFKVDGFVAIYSIQYESDKWKVSGVFKEKMKDVGAFEGTDVEYKDGVLTFKQKYIVKPRPTWADNEKFTVRLAGDSIVGVADKKDVPLRTFQRVGADGEPPPSKDLPPELKNVIGYWAGDASNNLKKFVQISHAKGNWSIVMNWYTPKLKLQGSALGQNFEIKDGKLTYKLKYLKKNPIRLGRRTPRSAWKY